MSSRIIKMENNNVNALNALNKRIKKEFAIPKTFLK